MKVCKVCILNDNMFSVKINEAGICNHCEAYEKSISKASGSSFEEKEKQLIEKCSQYKDKPYQVLLAYSGGKDSTYALYLLRKKYNLSVLTVTFDNGFLTEECFNNISEVTANLETDNIIIKPSFAKLAKVFELAAQKDIFPKKSLERASSICTACIGMVKASVYKEAIMRDIPFVSFGWTPGQVNLKASVVKLDANMLIANQKQIKNNIVKNLGSSYEKYFLDEQWLIDRKEHVPAMLYPLVFNNYSEHEIIRTISTLGWKQPPRIDTNSTNCLLNSYANEMHMKRYGFNPYNLEVAELVRTGLISREEGLKKVQKAGEEAVIEDVCKKLKRFL